MLDEGTVVPVKFTAYYTKISRTARHTSTIMTLDFIIGEHIFVHIDNRVAVSYNILHISTFMIVIEFYLEERRKYIRYYVLKEKEDKKGKKKRSR